VFKSVSITAFSLLLLSSALLSSQQTQSTAPQTGQPAQPSPSVYGRMRRMPPAQAQQPTTQAQQFPSPAQQFPPDQAAPASPGQRTPIRFPHPPAPSEQVTPPPQAVGAKAQQQANSTAPQPTTQQAAIPQTPTPSGAEQQPPNPPRVSYMGGLLTVAAENATLADILKAVGNVTHATLEGSQPEAERVFGQFGPGAPRQVLNSILSGTRYDFILVGAVDDPGSVERIMLSPHGTAPAVRGNAGQMVARQNVPTPNPDDDDTDVAEQPVIQQQAPPPVPSEQVQPPGQQQQQVKTPEQLLQELQRLRQQQQQQQPQQPGNVPR
jgi:hypothetical protein